MKKKHIIYGFHSCIEALKNKNRIINDIYINNPKYESKINLILKERNLHLKINFLEKIKFDKKIYEYIESKNEINHQGIFIETDLLLETNLYEFLSHHNSQNSSIVILDHVLDPSNIGSSMRICAAFNVDLIIFTKDHCPNPQSPLILKIASGAFENLKFSIVTNLSQTIDLLKKNGYWIYGLSLDHKNKKSIYETDFSTKSVIVMGSEENGLRKLTNDKIDFAINIPISKNIESLNISSALSIALYELNRP